MNPKNPKLLEETMNTVISTPNSSVKSSTTSDNYPSETRDSFYFPGCRKDANCNCEICIESMNATLDLIHSTRRSSLTKFSSSRPVGPKSPINFNPDMSTPKSIAQIRAFTVSPPLKSTARLNFEEKVKREKRDLGNWGFMRRVLLGLILVFGVEYGFSWLVSGVSRPSFTPNVVKSLAERSRSFGDLNGKFVFLKNELEWYVGKRVASCSSAGAVWKISQDGLLLNSRCVLYKSATEEVSIWGWPLQTAGLLTAEYSSRSFSIISGRVTEWSHEKVKYLVREANSTWEQGKWSSSVVQFDPNTWILEYRQSFILDNSRLISAAVKLLKVKVLREFEKMKQEFWLLKSFVKQYSAFTEGNILVPT